MNPHFIGLIIRNHFLYPFFLFLLLPRLCPWNNFVKKRTLCDSYFFGATIFYEIDIFLIQNFFSKVFLNNFWSTKRLVLLLLFPFILSSFFRITSLSCILNKKYSKRKCESLSFFIRIIIQALDSNILPNLILKIYFVLVSLSLLCILT